jgi:hypothetical protein
MRDFRRSDFVLNVGDNAEADVDLQLANIFAFISASAMT